jgi:predicted ester cyclase
MNAGVFKGKFKTDSLDEIVGIIRNEAFPALGGIPGFRGAQFWVDRASGDCVSVGMYDTAQARDAGGQVASQVMTRMEQFLEGPRPERELYDLATSTAMEARAVIERGMAAFNRGDMEQLARDSAPDIVATAPGGMEYRGPQAVKEFNQSWRTGFPDAIITATGMIAFGSMVVVEGEFAGTHTGTLATPMGDIPATGKRVSDRYVQVFTVDRGLVSRAHLYFDRMSLMSQLGVAMAPTGATS